MVNLYSVSDVGWGLEYMSDFVKFRPRDCLPSGYLLIGVVTQGEHSA